MEEAHVLRNEFAMVEVMISTTGSKHTLRIRNADTDDEITLDALELEALTRMSHRSFGPLILFGQAGES